MPRVAPRDGPSIQPHGALTAGAEALPQPVVPYWPPSTVVLDSLHATESGWDPATARRGESHPPRLAWVRAYLESRLAGPTAAVITALEAGGHAPTCTVTQRQAVRRTGGSYRRHQPDRHDDASLARGSPMGTGVVEGAWGHLMQDCLEHAGMRWTTGGAQAVLDLRAVRLTGPWEASGRFHRHQQPQRLEGQSARVPTWAEARARA